MDKSKFLKIKQILSSWIKDTKFENNVYVVGGCIRDMLMNKEIKDIDIAVSIPDGGLKLAQFLFDKLYINHKPVLYPTYGTAMFVVEIDGESFELEAVQTRKEKYTDPTQRNPITAFGTLEEDCLRRDLTINSLYQNISTDEIIDITGTGISDIEDKIIRTPCEPDITYDDDPLRILRTVRFASRYNWQIEETTYNSMKRNIHRLSIVSKERIQAELSKMLTCDYPAIALQYLKDIGAFYMIDPIFQNIYSGDELWQTMLTQILYVHQNYPAFYTEEMVLAIMLSHYHFFAPTESETYHYSKQPVVNFLKSLKYSNTVIDEVNRIIKYSNLEFFGDIIKSYKITKPLTYESSVDIEINDEALFIFQHLVSSEDILNKTVLLTESYFATININMLNTFNAYAEIRRASEAKPIFFDYKVPITGNDIMQELSLSPGPKVKEYMDISLSLAFKNPDITKEEILKHLKTL